MNEYRKIAVQIFSATVFNQINSTNLNTVMSPDKNPALRTNDKNLLGDLAGWVHYMKNTRIGITSTSVFQIGFSAKQDEQ